MATRITTGMTQRNILADLNRVSERLARTMSTMDEMLDVLINRTGRVGL